jgi:hypothetical protein
MQTLLLTGHFDDLVEFVTWTNDLVEDELLGRVIHRVIHFQLLPAERGGLDAVILVELESVGE